MQAAIAHQHGTAPSDAQDGVITLARGIFQRSTDIAGL
jgi:hypothetical protein